MTITVTFDPPLPSDSPATFNTKAFTLLGDLNDWSTQANALPAELAVDLVAERSATATLTNKTLTTPVLTNPSYSGTTSNGGTVTTIDINGGTIDGAAIGSTTPAAGAFTTVTASSPITLTSANPYVSFVGTAASQQWRIGDGINATNGNLVVYDYTGSIKALEITKATGAVTILGHLGIGSAPNSAIAGGFGNSIDVGIYGVVQTRNIGNNLFYYGGWKYPKGNNGTASWLLGGDAARVVLYVAPQCTGAADSTPSGVLEGLSINGATGAVTIPGTLSLTGGTFGYGAGAGGTVTQATSKSTAVTLNKPCGQITMSNEALAAGASVAFDCGNTFVDINDVICINPSNAAGSVNYQAWVSFISAATFTVCIKNISAGSLSDAVKLNFAVLKGATS